MRAFVRLSTRRWPLHSGLLHGLDKLLELGVDRELGLRDGIEDLLRLRPGGAGKWRGCHNMRAEKGAWAPVGAAQQRPAP